MALPEFKVGQFYRLRHYIRPSGHAFRKDVAEKSGREYVAEEVYTYLKVLSDLSEMVIGTNLLTGNDQKFRKVGSSPEDVRLEVAWHFWSFDEILLISKKDAATVMSQHRRTLIIAASTAKYELRKYSVAKKKLLRTTPTPRVRVQQTHKAPH